MRNLAFRRFQQFKHKQRARKRLLSFMERDEVDARCIGIHAATPKLCSCFMCGNPRHFSGGDSMQERRMRCVAGDLIFDE